MYNNELIVPKTKPVDGQPCIIPSLNSLHCQYNNLLCDWHTNKNKS